MAFSPETPTRNHERRTIEAHGGDIKVMFEVIELIGLVYFPIIILLMCILPLYRILSFNWVIPYGK